MINIPSPTGPGLPGAGSAQQTPIQQMMAQLNVKLGGTVEGLAARVENLSASQVMDLAKLAQAGSPQQRMVLNANSLNLVELRIQQQTFLTYTDQPIKAGDNLQVQYNSPKSLTLITQPNAGQLANTQQLPAALHTALMTALPQQQNFQQVFNALQAAQLLHQQLQSQQPPQLQSQHQLLSQQQPHKAPSSPSQAAPNQAQATPSQSATRHSSPQPQTTNTQLLTQNQLALIQQIVAKAPELSMLVKPDQVKQMVQSSGMFTESNTAKTLKQLATQLRATAGLSPQWAKAATPQAGAHTATGDIKTLLLQLQQQLQQSLSPPSNQTGEKASPLNLPRDMANLLLNNPQLANALKTLYNKAQQGGEQAARQWVREQVDAGLAKVLVQQLQSLQVRGDTGEPNRPQQWFFEIPFRQDGHTSDLRLLIERQSQREDEETTKSETPEQEGTTVWKVNLNFDLHDLGPMCAHLAVTTTTVDATLFAETDAALSKIQEHLPELEAAFESSGIEVKNMQCQRGIPQTSVKIHHQPLVDIRT